MSNPLNLKEVNGGRRLMSGPTVLFYHGVTEKPSEPNVSTLHHSEGEFAAQMAFLTRYFNVISMETLEKKLVSNGHVSSRDIVLTFDDGFKNNLTHAAPIVDEYSLTPTLFISTEHINSGRRYPTFIVRAGIWHLDQKEIFLETIQSRYLLTPELKKQFAIKDILSRLKQGSIHLARQLTEEIESLLTPARWQELNSIYYSEEVLNWEEVKLLADSGWEIGSHCKDHAILNGSNGQEAINEQVRESKAQITSILDDCKYFSYPNGEMGYVSEIARAEVERSGYSLAFTAQAGDLQGSLDRWLLPRRLAPKTVPHLFSVLQSSVLYRAQHRRWVESLMFKK